MEWLFAILGLVILLLAGDLMVRGAVNLSLRVGIPALLVSLTIVAFGTSAPELLISVKAIMDDAPGLALGNVVGSNTANILLVLGVPALISRLHTSATDTRKSYVMMLLVSGGFIAMAFMGPITWIDGLILLAVLALILGDQARDGLNHRRSQAADAAEEADRRVLEGLDDIQEIEGVDPGMPWWKIVVFLALGLTGLPLGADILVDASLVIAANFGVSDAELATTVIAAIRRQADVALGNVIGSNLFNLLAIIGIASLFGDIPVAGAFLSFDLWVMLGASVLLAPFVFAKRLDLTRRWGTALTLLYVVYIVMVVQG
mgnify:CR=1 FL=1